MPQQVNIKIEDCLVGELVTSNCGPGCSYEMCWNGRYIGKFDTGIATQCDASDSDADNRCDFTHARGGIAAVRASAQSIISELDPEDKPFRSADIQLTTNGYERGRVLIRAIEDGELTLEVRIGKSFVQNPK